MDEASLRGADLTGASLRDARLYLVDLTDADLTDADLATTELDRVVLSGARLIRTALPPISSMARVSWTESTDWNGCRDEIFRRSIRLGEHKFLLNPDGRDGQPNA
ncbi:pentapeptide repeat-containing protein [Nocardia sp. NBC_01377]|uniref:pentapeptide repeat-containing protein n=1 Tax=Nocardia sp. NBC_01377 TaxID=2903595 RepID=UPI003865210A